VSRPVATCCWSTPRAACTFDDDLMTELTELKEQLGPTEILFVAMR
jgi:hypothetical protein